MSGQVLVASLRGSGIMAPMKTLYQVRVQFYRQPVLLVWSGYDQVEAVLQREVAARADYRGSVTLEAIAL